MTDDAPSHRAAGPLDPGAPIPGSSNRTVLDFWRWAFSDLVANTTRGAFAEYLVGQELGVVDGQMRLAWDAVDLRYRGAAIEVKASGYAQSWDEPSKPTRHRLPSFSIGAALGWDAATNTYSPGRIRSADVYVFCVHLPQQTTAMEVLDPSSWQFYVLSTRQLTDELGGQKTVSLGRLRQLAEAIAFDRLRSAVDGVLDSLES